MIKATAGSIKKMGKAIGKIISLLSILFIAYAIYKLGFDFDSIPNWPVFFIVSCFGVLIKCVTVFIMATAWSGWLELFSKHKIDKKAALQAYVKANLGKYLPGNMMHYVERNMFAANLGVSQKKLAVGSIIEVLGLTSIAFIMALLVSFQYVVIAYTQIFGKDHIIPIIIMLLVVVLVSGVLWKFRTRIKNFIVDCGVYDFLITLLVAILRYAIVLAALGFIMVVLYGYMGGKLDWHNAMLIISGYIIAWVFGFLVPGASGGIGVRELITTVLLGPIIGMELILTLSVIHRLITIIGDFLSYILVIIYRKERDV